MWKLFLSDCISKQFPCLLPGQFTAWFHLLRLQNTFVCSFKNKFLPLPMCVCVTFFFPFSFCLFCVRFCCCCCYFVIFTSSLTRLSCLPVTHGNNFLLGDPPPGLTWRSPQLLQTPWHSLRLGPHCTSPSFVPQNLSMAPRPQTHATSPGNPVSTTRSQLTISLGGNQTRDSALLQRRSWEGIWRENC